VLEGTLYDVLPFQFHEERGAGGEYIPLRSRRPSVRYPLARIIVDDSLSLVFSDGHFPTLDSDDRQARRLLGDIAVETALNQLMLEAALGRRQHDQWRFCIWHRLWWLSEQRYQQQLCHGGGVRC
jgi:hypothetical protein